MILYPLINLPDLRALITVILLRFSQFAAATCEGNRLTNTLSKEYTNTPLRLGPTFPNLDGGRLAIGLKLYRNAAGREKSQSSQN